MLDFCLKNTICRNIKNVSLFGAHLIFHLPHLTSLFFPNRAPSFQILYLSVLHFYLTRHYTLSAIHSFCVANIWTLWKLKFHEFSSSKNYQMWPLVFYPSHSFTLSLSHYLCSLLWIFWLYLMLWVRIESVKLNTVAW